MNKKALLGNVLRIGVSIGLLCAILFGLRNNISEIKGLMVSMNPFFIGASVLVYVCTTLVMVG